MRSLLVIASISLLGPSSAAMANEKPPTVYRHYRGVTDAVTRKVRDLRLKHYGTPVPDKWITASRVLDGALDNRLVGPNPTQTPQGIARLLYKALPAEAVALSAELVEHVQRMDPAERGSRGYDHYLGAVTENLRLMREIAAEPAVR